MILILKLNNENKSFCLGHFSPLNLNNCFSGWWLYQLSDTHTARQRPRGNGRCVWGSSGTPLAAGWAAAEGMLGVLALPLRMSLLTCPVQNQSRFHVKFHFEGPVPSKFNFKASVKVGSIQSHGESLWLLIFGPEKKLVFSVCTGNKRAELIYWDMFSLNYMYS